MTIFMNLRQNTVGGGVKDPSFLDGNGTVAVPAMVDRTEAFIASAATGRNVLFATHGFNVNYRAGVCALGRLEHALALPSSALFIGVLWPGDFWIPVVNYPFAGGPAMDAGRRVADFVNRRLGSAASISLVSHSLGARLVLSAARAIKRPLRSVCVTAGAINDDCLTLQYADAFDHTAVVSVLASRKDKTLRLAYPVGDAAGLLLQGDHSPFEPALGYSGPKKAVGATVPPWQIEAAADYDHQNYLPPSDPGAPFPVAGEKWENAAGFMKRAFLGQPQTWP